MVARLAVLATAAGAMAVAGVAESAGPVGAQEVECGDRKLTLSFTGKQLARAENAAISGKPVGSNVATLRVVKGSNAENGLTVAYFLSDSTASASATQQPQVNPDGKYESTITAGDNPGTNVVTALIVGTNCKVSGTITQYGLADRVEVTLNPNPVPVSKPLPAVPPTTETLTVKATVKDAGGRPVRDESVAFSVTTVDPPTQPANGTPPNGATVKSSIDTDSRPPAENPSTNPLQPNNNKGDGTYENTYTVSQSPSRQTVLASIQGGPSAAKAGSAVVIQYGPPKSVGLTLSPSSLPASGYNYSQARATVRDAVDNPVPGVGVSFHKLSGPPLTFSRGGGESNAAGQVPTKIRGTQLGTAVIAATCGSGCTGQAPLALTTWADRLPTSGALKAGAGADRLKSKNGIFTALLQKDGNFVIYQAGKGAIWASRTRGFANTTAVMQKDGNFVIYAAGKGAIWSTRTRGFRNVTAVMQNDGNFVLYAAGVGAIWASHSRVG